MTPEIPIELRCPQCGAPVTLEESDRILSCGFCRVRLCLAFQGPASYRLTTPDLREEGLHYVPYWRYRGMTFSIQGLEIQHRVADSSHLAIRSPGLPPTLGFRPQVLKLKPIGLSRGNHFIKPQQAFNEVRTGANGALPDKIATETAGQPRKPFEVLIGESVHLVYTPVVSTEGGLWDPVVRRPLGGATADALRGLELNPNPGDSIRFLPMICPKCGWDLAGEKDTLAPLCRNCHTLWDSENGRLKELPFTVAPAPADGEIHLPFWKIRAEALQLRLQTQADLIRLANSPKVIRADMEEQSFEYFVSAFKVHPQLFLRLARSFTLRQPAGGLDRELPKTPLHPVTLPLEEALETLPILVGSFAVPRRAHLPRLSEMRFQHIGSELAFFPFHLKGTELIQADTGMSISRNALDMGRLL